MDQGNGWNLDYITRSTAITDRAVEICYASAYAAADTVFLVYLRDGLHVSSPIRGCISGLNRVGNNLILSNPAPFRNGLYIELNTNVSGVTILWRPLPKKA